MSEWLKEHAWKACVGETLPWVRIPLSPPIAVFSGQFRLLTRFYPSSVPHLASCARGQALGLSVRARRVEAPPKRDQDQREQDATTFTSQPVLKKESDQRRRVDPIRTTAKALADFFEQGCARYRGNRGE